MSSSVVLLFGSQAESNAANAIAAAMSRKSIAGLSQPNAQAANHKRDSGEGGAQHSVAHGAFKLRFRTTPSLFREMQRVQKARPAASMLCRYRIDGSMA
jgi:hypothetical protein